MFRRFGLFALAIAALASFTTATPAANVFLVQTDNWFISSFVNSCMAFNRRPDEYNHAPYNALAIRAPKEGGFFVEVDFWPGLFEHGASHRLRLQIEGRGFHEIDADSIGDHALRSRSPMSGDLLKDLDTGRRLTAGTASVSSSLAFDITRMRDILSMLDSCRSAIAGK